MAAISRALVGLSGKAEARMTGAPTYTVAREVGPGPQRLDVCPDGVTPRLLGTDGMRG